MSSTPTKEIFHPAQHGGEENKQQILLVVSNPSTSAQTGWPIGVWAAELTHAYHEFVAAGYDVVLASPDGGKIEFDDWSDPRHESGYSAGDLISMGFINTPSLMGLLNDTAKLSEVDPAGYAAIFLAGGQAPMYTFKDNASLMQFVANFYESGKPTAIVCHATTILTDTRLSSGQLLVEGRTWTGFSNAEEDFADQAVGTKIQPYRIEDNARAIENTNFTVKPPFSAYAVQDGNLITGQQQYSGAAAAQLVIQALNN